MGIISYKSKKRALIEKSRESMLAAVQIFNTPSIKFKSETFIVLSIISWTYIMHAYYEDIGVDYSYYELTGKSKRKRYCKNENGSIRKWDLAKCIKETSCPLDECVKNNLLFLIGIRNEIEHQMTNELDFVISSKLQACAINYNQFIIEHFGKKYCVDEELVGTIQFLEIDPLKQKELGKIKGISTNITNFIIGFEQNLSDKVIKDKRYAYRVMYIPINANKRGQADNVIEFVKADEETQENIKKCVVIKESEKDKYLPTQIVNIMHDEGHSKFSIVLHTRIWQNNGNSLKISKYGHMVAGKQWYWYNTWLDYIRDYCKTHCSELE